MNNTEEDLFEEREFSDKKWLWTKSDAGAWKYLAKTSRYEFPNYLSKFVKENNIVLQAGGHAGMYPHQYSKIFKQVITCEPEPHNFYCLEKNVLSENVLKKNCALGERSGTIKMSHPKSKKVNTGCFKVDGDGDIPMITIDSLNLTDCNLIHLDLEGYELFALKGAINTIQKFKPVIVLETNNCCLTFGYTIDQLNQWIKDTLNYKILEKLEDDTIYISNV